MSEFVDAARTVPFLIWVGIVFAAGLIWFAVEVALAPVIDDVEMCESCGAGADIELADGSFWCGDCDTAAVAFEERAARRERIRGCARERGAKR